MGWTGMSEIPDDRAAFCRGEINRDLKVLADSMVGSTWYAAIQKPDGEVFAAVFLTKIGRYQGQREFLFKSMDESVGPCERNCPKKILDLLTEETGERYPYAKAWREECRANLAKKREAAAGKGKFALGAILYTQKPMEFGDGNVGSIFTVIEGTSRKGKKVLRFRRGDGRTVMIGANARHRLLTAAELKVANDEAELRAVANSATSNRGAIF